jgi:hypothetical protein
MGVANTGIGVIRVPEPEPRIMRYALTDFEWAAIRPFLPNKPRGVPRVNDRRVLNGIFWIFRSGATWRDLPEGFAPYPWLKIVVMSGKARPSLPEGAVFLAKHHNHDELLNAVVS